jgi:flagellar biosynthetic protein FlhB
MPEKPASERTQKPTAERLRKARQEGQVAQSKEVPSALMVVSLLLVLTFSAKSMFRWMAGQVREGMSLEWAGQPMTTELYAHLIQTKAVQSFLALVPFLLAALAVSVFGSLIVGGWAFSPKAMSLKFERLNPVSGFKRLFSLRSVVTLLISMAKLAALMTLLWVFLRDRMGLLLSLHHASPAALVAGMADLVFSLTVRVAMALGVIALIDMGFQKWKHKQELKMSRQEVKEERKEHELSPELRGRVRALQIEMARKRMLQDVPSADMVIVNPTHVAVAIKYDSGSMRAPEVLAKGGDFLCEKIKEIARAHNVPILHRPELARALYATVDVGQVVPDTLFVAVAEVLAMIYRMRRRRQP